MRVTWETGDIKCGRRVGKPGIREQQMLAYAAAITDERRYTVVSLDDGMVQDTMTKYELAMWLNSGGYLPIEILAPDN